MAEAEEIKIKVTGEGLNETAKQFDSLNASMLRTAKSQEMIAKTSDQLRRNAAIEVIKQQAAAQNSFADAMTKTSVAANKANINLAALRQGLGPTTALVGTLGSAFSQLAPQTTGAFGALQKFTGAMSQAMALAGAGGTVAGPMGAVAGGIVGLISGIATAMGNAKREADELAKATQANVFALNNFIAAIDEMRAKAGAKRQQMESAYDREKRIYGGQGSRAEIEDEMAVNRALIEQNRDAAKPITSNMSWSEIRRRSATRQAAVDEIADLEEKNKRLGGLLTDAQSAENFAAFNARELKTANLEEQLKKEAEANKKKRVPAYRARDESEAFYMDQVGNANAPTSFAQEQLDRQKDLDAEGRRSEAEMNGWKRSSQLEIDMNKHTLDAIEGAREASVKKDIDRMARAAAEKKQILAQETAAQMAASQMVTGSILKGISEVIKGKKLELGAILEGLGDQFVAAGTGLIFTGLGISANPFTPGAGAGMVSIGTAEVAFGLGLGAVGANIPGGSNAGGGGSNPNRAGYPGGSTDPYRNSFTPPNQGPTIINLNFPTVLSPSAIDGARMESALRQAKRVYG